MLTSSDYNWTSIAIEVQEFESVWHLHTHRMIGTVVIDHIHHNLMAKLKKEFHWSIKPIGVPPNIRHCLIGSNRLPIWMEYLMID